jgi:hypothetical protein
MKPKSLKRTNPYLAKSPQLGTETLTSVASSTAVETGEDIKAIAAKVIRYRSSAKRVKLA